MSEELLRLYPPPAGPRSPRGLYLDLALRDQGDGAPLVYTNFIVTLDGRVSEVSPDGRRRVPQAAANPTDWRLYMELLAQSDVVLASGRHLWAKAAAGEADLLGLARFPDLIAWRTARGLPPMPAVAAIGRPPPMPPAGVLRTAPLLLLTPSGGRVPGWERTGAELVVVGRGLRFGGGEMVQALADRGHRLIYSVAGPQVLRTLLADDALDLLALTFAHAMIGGEGYDTLIRGEPFASVRRFALSALHYDPVSLEGCGQLFALYRPIRAAQGEAGSG